MAPPNLLRGVGVDAAHLTGFVEALGRPVVLVGHSHAGAVISQTGSDASTVAGLVYVAAYAPRRARPREVIGNEQYLSMPLRLNRRHLDTRVRAGYRPARWCQPTSTAS